MKETIQPNKRYSIAGQWILRNDPQYTQRHTLFNIESGRVISLSDGLYVIMKLFYYYHISINEITELVSHDCTNISSNNLINILSDLDEGLLSSDQSRSKSSSYNNVDPPFIGNYRVPVASSPIDMEIHLTRRCNLRCKHCFQESDSKVSERTINLADWERLFDDIESNGVNRVIISGGEPIMYDKFTELLSNIVKRRISIYILTNGILIDQSMLPLLNHKNVKTNISLDGADSGTHDFLRGKGAFDRVIGNIRKLVISHCNVIISHVIHKGNYTQLEKFVRYLVSLGVQEVSFNFIERIGRASGVSEIILSESEELQSLKCLLKLREHYSGRISINFPTTAYSTLPSIINPSESEYISCSAGTRRLAISANGDYYPCISAFGIENFRLGNCHSMSIEEAWSSNRLDLFRGTVSQDQLSECKSCSIFKACAFKNCRLKYFRQTHDYFAKPIECLRDKSSEFKSLINAITP